jgi:RNA polymerase sigma-70 factor (ECF subfamily)
MNHSEIDALSEKLLVVRAQGRDHAAFQQLVMQYERRVLYYVHRFLGPQIESADILQEIWMTVFLKINRLSAPEAFRVWLYKIAHDISINHLRRSRKHPKTSLTDDVATDLTDENDWNELELLEHAELVHGALEQLSLPHREVLTLRFLENLDLAEIATVAGCSLGTVKSRLHYAKTAMRQHLEAICHD